MDGRTGRVAYGGGNPHAGGLTLLRHGEAVLRRLGNRAGHSGRRLRGRLSGQLIQHLRDRAAGLPGGTDRTAGIAEAAAQCRDRCGNSGGLRCGGHSCGGGRTQRRSVCGHLCSKISRRKDHRIALHTACHIQLRQLHRLRLGFVLHWDQRRVELGHRRQRSFKLGGLWQVQRCLGADLLRGIIRRVAAHGAIDQRIQLIHRLLRGCRGGRGRDGRRVDGHSGFLGRL